MKKIAAALVVLSAILHLAFMVLEMFFWGFVAGKLLGLEGEAIEKTAMLGFNQGAYNGFIAVGLLVTFMGVFSVSQGFAVRMVLLASAAAAGLIGWVTVGGSAFFIVQMALPALALVLTYLTRDE